LVILTFFLARVVPADPVALIAGEGATREQIQALRHRYGFDLPLYVQLGVYLRQLTAGDLGMSIYTGRPVLDDILERFPATIELTLVSIGTATLLGIPLGVLSALRRNSWLDHFLRTFTTAGLAITGFWLGIMLQLLFSMDLDLLPLGGRIGVPAGLIAGYCDNIVGDVVMRLADIFLAVPRVILALALAQALGPSLPNMLLALTITYWPWFARTVAAETRSVKQSTFVEASEALGTRPTRIIFCHVLPNVLSPIIVRSTIGMGFTILTAAALGFLGVGAQPPAPEWGAILPRRVCIYLMPGGTPRHPGWRSSSWSWDSIC